MRRLITSLAILIPSVALTVTRPPKGKSDSIPHFLQKEDSREVKEEEGSTFFPTKPFVSQPVVLPFANIKVNDDTTALPQLEPYIAVSGNQVYAFFKDWRLGTKQTFFARSLDSGDTWQANYPIYETTYTFHTDPVIRVHPNGNLFAGFMGHKFNPSASDIFVARSTNQGVSFGIGQKVSTGSTNVFSDKPWLEIGASGKLYVTWSAFDNGLGGGMARVLSVPPTAGQVGRLGRTSATTRMESGPVRSRWKGREVFCTLSGVVMNAMASKTRSGFSSPPPPIRAKISAQTVWWPVNFGTTICRGIQVAFLPRWLTQEMATFTLPGTTAGLIPTIPTSLLSVPPTAGLPGTPPSSSTITPATPPSSLCRRLR